MANNQIIEERKLAALAKKFRKAAGVSKAEAGRVLGVKRGTIHQAEDYPEFGLTKLRVRMIETYSNLEIVGPVFLIRKKRETQRAAIPRARKARRLKPSSSQPKPTPHNP